MGRFFKKTNQKNNNKALLFMGRNKVTIRSIYRKNYFTKTYKPKAENISEVKENLSPQIFLSRLPPLRK